MLLLLSYLLFAISKSDNQQEMAMRSMISTALRSKRLLTLVAAATISALPVAAMAKDHDDKGRRDDDDRRAPAARVDNRDVFRQWNHDDRGGDYRDRDYRDRGYRDRDDRDRDRDDHARAGVGIQIGGRDDCAPDRVWVEPVYRTVCDQVYVPAEYRTVCDRVWVAPVTKKVTERVWVEPKYEARPVDPFGRIHAVEKVQVKCGHWEDVCREVVVCPGHYEDVQRQELVCAAHYTSVERQELLTPGHWEYRGHDRDGFALNLRFPSR